MKRRDRTEMGWNEAISRLNEAASTSGSGDGSGLAPAPSSAAVSPLPAAAIGDTAGGGSACEHDWRFAHMFYESTEIYYCTKCLDRRWIAVRP